jgi:hypothetical protein
MPKSIPKAGAKHSVQHTRPACLSRRPRRLLSDVAAAFPSFDASDYLKKLRKRDPSLDEVFKGWVQIVHTLSVPTDGGPQPMLCANTEGLFRLIQPPICQTWPPQSRAPKNPDHATPPTGKT